MSGLEQDGSEPWLHSHYAYDILASYLIGDLTE
jgi:hypothetical protein